MTKFRNWLSALLPIALCLALLGTIFLTLFDWQWIAFLSGVFIAAVLALSSRATSAEWRVARRSRQIEKLRERLAAQAAQCRAAEQREVDSDARNRLLYDASESLIVYVDAYQVCRFHNLAFASSVGDPEAPISGRTLRDVLGDEAHSRLKIALERILEGKSGQFEHTLTLSQRGTIPYAARFIANCTPDGRVSGCWVLLTEADARAEATPDFLHVAGPAHGAQRAPDQAAAVDETTGELQYLESMAEDLTGWEDPKARFLEALEGDQFCILYQSIRRVAPGLTGPEYAEILVRLEEEEQKLLPPGAFFPVAERYHLMASLDRWVVRTVLNWYQTKRRQGEFPRFCVNLSSDSIVDETFIGFLREEIERNNLPGIALCFELAEPDILAHQADAVRLTGELAAIGSEVTVDGFGGASSSFSYLHDMAVNFLKIDGSIIANVHRDPVCLAKARAITRAAHLTKRYTIAEFVESQDTLDVVRELGVDYVQGFGIAKPRSLSLLEKTEAESSAIELGSLRRDHLILAEVKEPAILASSRYPTAANTRPAGKTGDGRKL